MVARCVALVNHRAEWYGWSMDPHKAMTIRLPAEQAEDLDIVAAVDGQPVSQVIRMAIEHHIEERMQDEEFQDGLRHRIQHAQRLLPGD